MQDTDKPYQAQAVQPAGAPATTSHYPFPSERFEATVLVGDNYEISGEITVVSFCGTLLVVYDAPYGGRQVIPMSAVSAFQFSLPAAASSDAASSA